MLFRKEKISLSTFTLTVCSDIISLKALTYDDYLAQDPEKALNNDEFNLFNDNVLFLKLLLLTSLLDFERCHDRLIIDVEKFGYIMGQSVYNACLHNNYSKNDCNTITRKYLEILDLYSNEAPDIMKKSIQLKNISNHYIYSTCVFFTNYLLSLIDNTKYDKGGTISALVKNNRDIIIDHFNRCMKRVKLVVE